MRKLEFPQTGKFRRYHGEAWVVKGVERQTNRVQLIHPTENTTVWAYLGEIGRIDLDPYQVERLNGTPPPTPSAN